MALSDYGALIINADGDFVAGGILLPSGYLMSCRKFSLSIQDAAELTIAKIWPDSGDGAVSLVDGYAISWQRATSDGPTRQQRPAYYFLLTQNGGVLAAVLCFAWSDSLYAWVQREAPNWLAGVPDGSEYCWTSYSRDSRTGLDITELAFTTPDGSFLSKPIPQRNLSIANLPGACGLKSALYEDFLLWLDSRAHGDNRRTWLSRIKAGVPRYYNQGDAFFDASGVCDTPMYVVGEDPNPSVAMQLIGGLSKPEEPRWLSYVSNQGLRLNRYHSRIRANMERRLFCASLRREARKLDKEKNLDRKK